MEYIEIVSWLKSKITNLADQEFIEADISRPFSDFGLDSNNILEMTGDLEILLDRKLDHSLIFDYPNIDSLAKYLSNEHQQQLPVENIKGPDEPIAIVGIGCRFPGKIQGPDDYWQFLREGKSGISTLREMDRVDDSPIHPDSVAGFLSDIDKFDADFFRISPVEAKNLDPQQRFLLEVSWEAFEDAKILPAELKGSRTGVFIGISNNEYKHFLNPVSNKVQQITGNALSIAANRLSYSYGFNGPSLAVDTACSSSLTAVDIACRYLRNGDCNVAVAGGANIALLPEVTEAFAEAGLMASDGKCKSFDDEADGYVRGEGVAVVILKPRSKAISDGDRIYANILSGAVVQDGDSNGLMAPSGLAQQMVIRDACDQAGIEPSDYGYIECHGTGTSLGDVIEYNALSSLVSLDKEPGKEQKAIPIGSVKSNLGHLESAAGIAGLIKVALCIKNKELVPSINFNNINSGFNTANANLKVQTQRQEWERVEKLPYLAGISSLGFGGTNVHLVLSEAEPSDQVISDTSSEEPSLNNFLFSAKTSAARTALAKRHQAFLETGLKSESITDYCSAAVLGRTHHKYRASLLVNNRNDLLEKLGQYIEGQVPEGCASDRAQLDYRPLAFVFTGQGDQWATMGQSLFHHESVFREYLIRANETILKIGGWSLIECLFTDAENSELGKTEFAQPAIVSFQIAFVELLKHYGIVTSSFIGHSIGEISAAYANGELGFEDALVLSFHRGQAMSSSVGQGEMMIVSGQSGAVKDRIESKHFELSIAAINSKKSLVLAGTKKELERFRSETGDICEWHKFLNYGYAFHSTQMIEAAEEYYQNEPALAAVDLRGTRYSTSEVSRVNTQSAASLSEDYWTRNILNTVNFEAAINLMLDDGLRCFIEIGSGRTLSGHIATIANDRELSIEAIALQARNIDSYRAWQQSLGQMFVKGIAFDIKAIAHRAKSGQHLPLYPWSHSRYWADPDEVKNNLAGVVDQIPRLIGDKVNIANSNTTVWDCKLDRQDHSYLDDHKIVGMKIFPAAAYISMLLDAVWDNNERSISLDEIQFSNSLILGKYEPHLQVVKTSESDVGKIEIFSIVDKQPATSHCVAQIPSLANTNIESPAYDNTLKSSAENHMTGAYLYQLLSQSGYQYGEQFRLVEEIWSEQDQAIGRISKSATLLDTKAGISPNLLDACMHVIAAANINLHSNNEQPPLYIPKGMESLFYKSIPNGEIISHCKISERDHLNSFKVDLAIYSDDALVLSMTGLQFQRIGNTVRPLDQKYSDFLYHPEWRAIDQPELIADGRMGTWLVFGQEAFVQEIEDEFGQQERLIVGVNEGDFFSTLGDTRYQVSMDDAEQISHVIQTVSAKHGAISGVIFQHPGQGHKLSPHMPFSNGVVSLHHVLVSIIRHSKGESPQLIIVTKGAHSVAGETHNPAQSSVWGYAKGIVFEHPDLRCLRVDLDPADDLGVDVRNVITAAIGTMQEEDQFAIRQGEFYVPRLFPVRKRPLKNDVQRIDISAADASYMIAGGGGSLGLLLATDLISKGAANIILVGRSKMSERVEELIKGHPSVNIIYEACDIADRRTSSMLLSKIKKSFPPIRGFYQCAGVLDDGVILNLSAERIVPVLRAKINGTVNVVSELDGSDLDFVVLYSSAASVLGSPGQASYMAANAFLDSYSYYLNNQGVNSISINWGPWDSSGMSAGDTVEKSLSQKLIKMINVEQGLEICAGLQSCANPQVAVLPFDLKSLVQFYPSNAGVAYFNEVMDGDMSTIRSDGGQEKIYSRPDLDTKYVSPETEVEITIAGIWSSALGMDKIGIDDQFFELGGDSVFASQIYSQVTEIYGVRPSMEDAYDNFSIRNLAKLVEQALYDQVMNLTDEEADILMEESNPAAEDHVR